MTSIEWLIEKWNNGELNSLSFHREKLFEQAKEMHKQEIIDAVEQFSATGTGTCYYNETFNK
jgi:hypothetical protein